MITHIGVPLFFMCSGSVLLRVKRDIKEIYMHNIAGILKVYICWMLLFGISDCIQAGKVPLRIAVNLFLKAVLFGRYHTWFIFTLIGLYAIVPLLQKITADTRSTEYFLLLSVLFTILIPLAGNYEILERAYRVAEDVNMRFVVGYTLYFVLGYYLSVIKFRPGAGLWTGGLLAGSVVLAYILSNRAAFHVGTDCQKIYHEFAPLGFLMTTACFCFLKSCFQMKENLRAEKLMSGWAAAGIGIYLFHPLLLPFFETGKGVLSIGNGFAIYMISLVLMLVIGRCPLINNLFLNIKNKANRDS